MESEAPTQEEVLDTNPMDIKENPASKKDVSEDTHREEIGNEEDEGLRIPLARVKRIIKQDPDVKLIATDSCFLISKATELFLEFIVNETYAKTKADHRKVIQYQDLAKAVKTIEELEFLTDVIP